MFQYMGPMHVLGMMSFAALLVLGLMLFRAAPSFQAVEAQAGAVLVSLAMAICALIVEAGYRKSRGPEPPGDE